MRYFVNDWMSWYDSIKDAINAMRELYNLSLVLRSAPPQMSTAVKSNTERRAVGIDRCSRAPMRFHTAASGE